MNQPELDLSLAEGTPTFFQYQTGWFCATGLCYKCEETKCDCRCHFQALLNGSWRRLSEAQKAARSEARFFESLGLRWRKEDGKEARDKAKKEEREFGF